jgi:hypothetical protein
VALSPAAVSVLAEQRAALFAEGIRYEYIFATTTGERTHGDALKPILYGLRGMRTNGQPASTDRRAKARPVMLPADVTIPTSAAPLRTLLNRLARRRGSLTTWYGHAHQPCGRCPCCRSTEARRSRGGRTSWRASSGGAGRADGRAVSRRPSVDLAVQDHDFEGRQVPANEALRYTLGSGRRALAIEIEAWLHWEKQPADPETRRWRKALEEMRRGVI